MATVGAILQNGIEEPVAVDDEIARQRRLVGEVARQHAVENRDAAVFIGSAAISALNVRCALVEESRDRRPCGRSRLAASTSARRGAAGTGAGSVATSSVIDFLLGAAKFLGRRDAPSPPTAPAAAPPPCRRPSGAPSPTRRAAPPQLHRIRVIGHRVRRRLGQRGRRGEHKGQRGQDAVAEFASLASIPAAGSAARVAIPRLTSLANARASALRAPADAWQAGAMSAAPRISFVSLGCPKALVDSERILTRLRAEGYELSQGARRGRRGHRQHLRLSRQRQSGIAGRDRRGAEGERPRHRHRLHGRRAGSDPRGLSRTCRRSPVRRTIESVMAAVHEAAPAPHNPFLDLIPEQGVKLTPRHYAYLKIAEGCDHSCTLLHHPEAARPARLAPGRRRAARGGEARARRRQGNPRHLAGHQRLRPRPRLCDEPVARPRGRRALPRSRPRARPARAVDPAALRLPLPACRRGRGADERRRPAALSRRAVPARLAQGAEGDAAAGQPGKDAGAHPRLARDHARS